MLYQIHRSHMKRRKSLPPGPPSLPLIGSIPFMNGDNGLADSFVHPSLYKYDPYLCTVWIGMIPLIMIQDYALAKDLFSSDDFSGRILGYHDQYIRGKGGQTLGIITTAGQFWQEQRRFTLKHLKDLGFGRSKLDSIVQDEVNDVLKALELYSKTGQDVMFDSLFNFPIINILWQIVASRKYNPDEPETKAMMNKIREFFEHGPSFINFIPFIRPYVPYQTEDKLMFAMKRMFREQITEHENTFDEEDEPKDFVDYYLREIYNRNADKDKVNVPGDYANFNVEQLIAICMDFFQAGSETTSTTLSWVVMYLALYPIVQEKCQKEVYDTIRGMN